MNYGFVVRVEAIAPTNTDGKSVIELQRDASTILFNEPINGISDVLRKGFDGVVFILFFLSAVLKRFSENS